MNKHITVKKRLLLTLCSVLMLCGIGVLCAISSPQTAHAQGNTDISTFTGTESFSHKYIPNFFTKGEDYNENLYTNTGIQFYASPNTGYGYTGNFVKLDSTIFTVDFTNAKVSYPISGISLSGYLDRQYSFEILNTSGYVVWYARFFGYSRSVTTGSGDTSSTTYYYKNTFNVKGRITYSPETTNVSNARANLSLLGKPTVNLSSGNYTLRITRDYTWSQRAKGNILPIPSSYNSTSRLTGTLLVDTVAPTLSIRGYNTGNNIASGAYSKERATVTANETNFNRLYYKTPSMSGYGYTTSKSYTIGTETGWYYFYVTDTCNNQSVTSSFYYDGTPPIGKIYANGSPISGSYIGENFSYSATDSGSGVTEYFYKTPNSGEYLQYMPGMVINKTSGDGWYYFYCKDKSGNISATSSVYLETASPIVCIYRNGDLSYSKTVTTAGTFETDLYYNVGDSFKITCDTSSGNVTSNYALNTDITITNSYPVNFDIRLTTATGITSIHKVHIVRDMPKLVIDGTEYKDGETLQFNADTTFSWTYDKNIRNTLNSSVSITSVGDKNIDENFLYSSGKTSFDLKSDSGTETVYTISLSDVAGNEAVYTVVIDKKAPNGKILSNGNEMDNEGYTNKPVCVEFTENGVTAKYSVNGGEYLPYTSRQILTGDAIYKILLTDRAGNKTTYTVTVDTVAPSGQLYADFANAESGTITNGKIYFSWDDNFTATVNGMPYAKNTVLSGDGTYTFVLTDFADNTATYFITVDTAAPSYNSDKLVGDKMYKVSKWYTATVDGVTHSFLTRDEALAFACGKEFSSGVKILTLNNVSDFTQTHLVASNGNANNHDDEVRTGTYWLYKSKANPNSLLYYFDENLLNETVAHYAKVNVSSVNYYILDGNNDYGTPSGSMHDNMWISSDGIVAPIANNFIFEQADSNQIFAELMGGDGTRKQVSFGIPFGKQFLVNGLYKITEIDKANNESVYYVYLDLLAPELKVTATIFGNENPTELNITKESLAGIAAYYYESFNIKTILYADKWSVLTVTNNGKTSYYTYDDELPILNVGGEYSLTVYDRLGNTYDFTVYIVGNPAEIAFENNSDDTAFEVNITLEQDFDTVVTLEIFRNGILINGVSTDKLSYVFDKDGTYTVTLRDNFGRVIEQEYTFVKSLPSGTLSGVTNGGKTKTDVTFTYDSSKYYAVLVKDGAASLTDKTGGILVTANDSGSGSYTVKLINLTDELNFIEYTFVVNTLAPAINLSGVKNEGTTNGNVTVSWNDTDITEASYSVSGGEAQALISEQILTAEGTYTITVTNDLGTVTTLTFTIDKSLNYYVTVGESTVDSVDATNQAIAVFNNEPLSISVMLNGQSIDYEFGSVLSGEGIYSFRETDEFGNAATFTVTIDKSVSYTMNVANGGISNGDVYFANGEKLTVTITKDGAEFKYNFGEKLNEEGYYKATLRDTNGNEKTVEFRIVNGVKKSLDYTLGAEVKVLSVTLNGEPIPFDGNRLNFTADGEYAVTVESENQTYTFILLLDSTAPGIILDGVTYGGAADGVVIINTPSEEAIVSVYFNGELIAYEFGQELSEYGEYRVVVTDLAGNVSEYTFTLKHMLNGGAVALIVIVILVLIAAVVAVVILRKKVNSERISRPKRQPKTTLKLPQNRVKRTIFLNRIRRDSLCGFRLLSGRNGIPVLSHRRVPTALSF